MKICRLVLILLTIVSIVSQGIPKIVWVYWIQGYENAPYITQLCLNNMRKYAEN
jgi:hypothetical protein